MLVHRDCNVATRLMNQYNIAAQDILLLEARPRIGGRIYTTFETANVVNENPLPQQQEQRTQAFNRQYIHNNDVCTGPWCGVGTWDWF